MKGKLNKKVKRNLATKATSILLILDLQEQKQQKRNTITT